MEFSCETPPWGWLFGLFTQGFYSPTQLHSWSYQFLLNLQRERSDFCSDILKENHRKLVKFGHKGTTSLSLQFSDAKVHGFVLGVRSRFQAYLTFNWSRESYQVTPVYFSCHFNIVWWISEFITSVFFFFCSLCVHLLFPFVVPDALKKFILVDSNAF